MTDLITIIVPIYNVEKYINKCIDSILSQTYSNIEIILVDDGSPDNCGIICDQYASMDNRIKIIHKLNGGLSDARNVGLDIATGKYVTFIDSDDYIESTYVECLYNLLKKYNADMSICEFNIITEDGKVINRPLNNKTDLLLEQKKAIEILLKQKPYSNSVSGKLFKTSDFNDIRFPVGKLYEDVLTTYKLFLKCNVIVFGAFPLYYYVQYFGSISRNVFSEKQLDSIYNAEIMVRDIVKIYPDLYKAGVCRMLDSYIGVLKKVYGVDKQKTTYKYVIDKIYSIRSIVLFSKEATFKRRVIALLSFLEKRIFIAVIRKI